MKTRYNEYNKTTSIDCGDVRYVILWPCWGTPITYMIWIKEGVNDRLLCIDKTKTYGVAG